MAVVCAKGSLFDVHWVHPHLVVTRAEVELGEEPRPVELVEELVNHQDRKLALRNAVVERPVVGAEAP